MKSILLVAAMLCVSAPAFAQPCLVKRTDAGLASVTSADISKDGKSAQKILLVTGPILSPLTLNPDVTGYSFKTGEQAALYMYRFGASVPDKDWREAGSIGTQEGGFGIDWPRISKDGKPVALRVVVQIGGLGREDKPTFPAKAERDGVQLLLSDDIAPPPNRVVVGVGASAEATANTRITWSMRIQARRPMSLLLYDLTATRLIASAAFVWPNVEATQARYVADITALRKAFADKTCAKG